MNTKEDVIKFMTDNMACVGFGNWVMALKVLNKMDSDAEIIPSIYGQRLILKLPKSFFNLHITEQHNHLLHELTHCRELVKQLIVDDYCKVIKENEEEKCINDLVKLSMNWTGRK